MSIVYLNGAYMDEADAKIFVMDRGFIFADGIYEVMPVYNRHVFRLEEHLDRLQDSLDAIHIKNPHSIQQWQGILENLVEKNEDLHQSLYLQLTRGVAEREHVFSDNMQPTVFAISRPLVKKEHQKGVSAISCDDIRWKYCHIKSIALLPSVLLRYEAHQKGAYEAILIRDGYLTEGAATNVFIVKDNVVKTPPKDGQVLPGITRELVIELLRKNFIDFNEIAIEENELKNADEIWITSSTQEIIPVTILDGRPVNDGEVGPIWNKTNTIYQAFKQDFTGADI